MKNAILGRKILATFLSAALVLSMAPLAFAVGAAPGDSFVEYEGVAESGVSVSVTAPEGAFPDDAEMSVSDADVSLGEVSTVVSEEAEGDILGLSAVDISFEGEQPAEAVSVSIEIPASDVPEGASEAVIVHMAEDGPEVVAAMALASEGDSHSLEFTAEGFSSYAAVFVNGRYDAKKMSEVLASNSEYADRYSIASFAVDLFDYDPDAMNKSLNSAVSDGKSGFHLTGYGVDGCGSNNGINNAASGYAKQGILKDSLVDGLPVVNYLDGAGAGEKTGEILFGDTTAAAGKTIYNDIPFEFVYDSYTGWYEYKSSANHAQLNDGKTKIEMYADTLSTNNKYVATLDLSKAYGSSDLVNFTATESLYSATAKDSSGNDRLDPYVSFPVESIDASKVGQIYVKAKVPASVGTNNFQLFFATDTSGSVSETNSFYTIQDAAHYGDLEYTPNGDYVEFVIDTSTNPNWKGKVTEIRVDLFDSNKGDVSANGSYSVEIAQVSFIEKDYDDYVTRGGFYPFSDIRESYPGNNAGFDLEEWADHMQASDETSTIATRSIFKTSPKTNDELYEELAYGVVMEFDFYIPVGGQVDWGNGLEDLVYYFDGDDDLWVFVDDQLVLDIGGGHGAILGTANFTSGEVMVENAVTVTGYNTGATSEASAKTSQMDASLYAPGKHTMKVFYLERCGSVSNCYMKFNLPQTPEGDVTVSKETVGLDESLLDDEVFEFTVAAEDKGTGSATEGQAVAWANQSYYVVDVASGTVVNNPASSDGSFTTSANGTFTLNAGQEARFVFDENYEVTVRETEKDIAGYEHVCTKINGALASSGASLYELTQTTADETACNYVFENTYQELEAEFTYIPVNPDGCPDDQKGTVALTGLSDPEATFDSAGLSETVGMRVGAPVGSTAAGTKAVKFVGWYSDPACSEDSLVSYSLTLAPTKASGVDVWANAVYYAKFEYMYGDLTIAKSGISSVDHHAKTSSSQEESQSVIFNVKGTSYFGVALDMDVTVHFDEEGEGSTAVKMLPVGEYVVTEKGNWSWRYDIGSVEDSDKGSDAVAFGDGYKVVVDESGNTLSFTNERDNPSYWLGGDNWCRNLFNTESVDKIVQKWTVSNGS